MTNTFFRTKCLVDLLDEQSHANSTSTPQQWAFFSSVSFHVLKSNKNLKLREAK